MNFYKLSNKIKIKNTKYFIELDLGIIAQQMFE